MTESQLVALARPAILKMHAYQSARSLVADAHSTIFLDANESPKLTDERWNRYPAPQPRDLLERFASLYGVTPEQIAIGRGSDESIDLLTRIFCEHGKDQIITFPPTYGMYEVSADTQGASVLRIPMVKDGAGWHIDLNQLIRAVGTSEYKTKIIYICSPNNPTGGVVPNSQIADICRAVTNSLVVVDEAYAEFSGQSALSLLATFSNLVVLRTLSKAWGLAGVRCGVAIATPAIVNLINKVRAPYPVPEPVIEIVREALAKPELTEARVSMLMKQKEWLAAELAQLPQVKKVYPSEANFLLVEFENAERTFGFAKQHNIILRRRDGEPGLAGCIRITVGNEMENARLLHVLKEVPAS